MKKFKSKIMVPVNMVGYFTCSLISRVALKVGNVVGEKSSSMLSKVASSNI